MPAATAPKLIVAIAVDQFSADLFAEYRAHFTGGLARLGQGAVFPSGYQSHAATETCPGHATILTGVHPSRAGIIANTWIDQSVGRAKKAVYCAEDVSKVAADPKDYVASVTHLLVPTLGDRMKALWPASRNVAVSGKGRGALMMGGHAIDQVYWWRGSGFATLEGRTLSPAAVKENASVGGCAGRRLLRLCIAGMVQGQGPRDPAERKRHLLGSVQAGLQCRQATRAVSGRPRISTGPRSILRRKWSTNWSWARAPVPDVLSVSLSATDYVGHGFGTEGAEMCIQMQQARSGAGRFFMALDQRGSTMPWC